MLTPEERGPRPWWAYDSRDRLNLSDVQVAQDLPGPRRGQKYNPATIRKAETGEAHMSKPLWRQLTVYYTAVARKEGIPLDPIPGGPDEGKTPDQSDVAAAIDRQTRMLGRVLKVLIARFPEASPDLLDEVTEAIEAGASAVAEAEAQLIETGSSQPPQKLDPSRRASGKRPKRLPDGAKG